MSSRKTRKPICDASSASVLTGSPWEPYPQMIMQLGAKTNSYTFVGSKHDHGMFNKLAGLPGLSKSCGTLWLMPMLPLCCPRTRMKHWNMVDYNPEELPCSRFPNATSTVPFGAYGTGISMCVSGSINGVSPSVLMTSPLTVGVTPRSQTLHKKSRTSS